MRQDSPSKISSSSRRRGPKSPVEKGLDGREYGGRVRSGISAVTQSPWALSPNEYGGVALDEAGNSNT